MPKPTWLYVVLVTSVATVAMSQSPSDVLEGERILRHQSQVSPKEQRAVLERLLQVKLLWFQSSNLLGRLGEIDESEGDKTSAFDAYRRAAGVSEVTSGLYLRAVSGMSQTARTSAEKDAVKLELETVNRTQYGPNERASADRLLHRGAFQLEPGAVPFTTGQIDDLVNKLIHATFNPKKLPKELIDLNSDFGLALETKDFARAKYIEAKLDPLIPQWPQILEMKMNRMCAERVGSAQILAAIAAAPVSSRNLVSIRVRKFSNLHTKFDDSTLKKLVDFGESILNSPEDELSLENKRFTREELLTQLILDYEALGDHESALRKAKQYLSEFPESVIGPGHPKTLQELAHHPAPANQPIVLGGAMAAFSVLGGAAIVAVRSVRKKKRLAG